ncbi:MAG: hypothetical protein JWQ04_91 [Pedosphaera sp.]|nr:hypothetical protein [Pedosphaera sp.]
MKPVPPFFRGWFLYALERREALRADSTLGKGYQLWRANTVLRNRLQMLGGLMGAW